MSKGTPHRPIRINDALWAKAQEKATAEGTTASEVIRRLLEEWIAHKTNQKRETMGKPENIDRDGLAAARRYAEWHIGDRNWADLILKAYANPEETIEKLDQEQEQ